MTVEPARVASATDVDPTELVGRAFKRAMAATRRLRGRETHYPGKLSYASGSSSAIVSGATFAHNAGLDLLHVPYKSSPPALNDVMGGRVSMMFVDILTGLPLVNGGALRALAVTTKDRSPLVPQLPSMRRPACPISTSLHGRAISAPPACRRKSWRG